MIDIGTAILAINPNAEFRFENENINNIEWINGTTPIPKADIEVKMLELQVEYDAKQYQRDRASKYPAVSYTHLTLPTKRIV